MEIPYQFIIQCRLNTFKEVTPCNISKFDTSDYKTTISLGLAFINERGLSEFSNNFQGDQYFVALWTAHIIYEYANPDNDLKAQCVEVIKHHTNNPLSPKVSEEEQKWLEINSIE